MIVIQLLLHEHFCGILMIKTVGSLQIFLGHHSAGINFGLLINSVIQILEWEHLRNAFGANVVVDSIVAHLTTFIRITSNLNSINA